MKLEYKDVNELVTRDMEGMKDYDIAVWITELLLQLCRLDKDIKSDTISDIKEMWEQDNDE